MEEYREEQEQPMIVPENENNIHVNNKSDNSSPEEKRIQLKKRVKQIAIAGGGLFVLWIIFSVLHIFISPDKHIQQIYLVPQDAVFIIQSSEPVKDWRKFSESDIWHTLKQVRSLDEITQNVETLDSVIQNNKALLSLVGKRDLLISVHKTRPADWDFLILLDLQKTSKLNLLKDQIENVVKLAGFKATHREYEGINILELRDPDSGDILYTAFVDNHFVASYTSRLVEAAIKERKNPGIGLNDAFIDVEKIVAGKGLFRMFVNYAYLPQFMTIYSGETNEYIDLFSKSMEFAGLSFNLNKDRIELKGHTLKKEEADPYVTALLNSGKHKIKAHEIMSDRTAFYTNIGFENPSRFIKELESVLSAESEETYNSYKNSCKKIESLFGISLEDNFLSWMSGEFAFSQSEPGLLGSEPELILAIRAKSIKDARKNMEFIEKKIKNRTPIKIKSVSYKKYDVNYVELKGFFRLFFGGLFDRFEKPYYTYLGDYVVFSNKPSSLLSFIEDYERKNLLKHNQGFKEAFSRFNGNSTIFMYTDIHKFYPLLQPLVNATTWKDLQTNKDVFYSFPYWSMQINGEKNSASLQYVLEYVPYSAEEVNVKEEDPDEMDEVMDENAATEKQLMNELKRFYVEKFQGNVLREFYPEGALKSESEIKDGKRQGRYREYYESGKLKSRGKYMNNRPKGTWKYYTEEGKFDRKQKF